MAEGAKILIVDDEAAIVNVITFRLRTAGYETIAAYDGREALDLAAREPPQLILLDGCLPGLHGLAVLAELKRQDATRQVPIVFLSGADTDRDASLAQGAAFLRKPFRGDELLSVVRSLIHEPAIAERPSR